MPVRPRLLNHPYESEELFDKNAHSQVASPGSQMRSVFEKLLSLHDNKGCCPCTSHRVRRELSPPGPSCARTRPVLLLSSHGRPSMPFSVAPGRVLHPLPQHRSLLCLDSALTGSGISMSLITFLGATVPECLQQKLDCYWQYLRARCVLDLDVINHPGLFMHLRLRAVSGEFEVSTHVMCAP